MPPTPTPPIFTLELFLDSLNFHSTFSLLLVHFLSLFKLTFFHSGRMAKLLPGGSEFCFKLPYAAWMHILPGVWLWAQNGNWSKDFRGLYKKPNKNKQVELKENRSCLSPPAKEFGSFLMIYDFLCEHLNLLSEILIFCMKISFFFYEKSS